MLKIFSDSHGLTDRRRQRWRHNGLYFFDFIFIQIVCRPSFKTIEHEIIQWWSRRVLWVVGYVTYVTLPPIFFFFIAAEEVQSRIILPGALCIRAFQKNLNCFYSQGDLPECSLDKMSRWKIFLAKSTASVCSTEPAWLACFRSSTSPS